MVSCLPSVPGISKQDLRQQVWDYMEAHNLADFPRPVHGRIPNFKVLCVSKGEAPQGGMDTPESRYYQGPHEQLIEKTRVSSGAFELEVHFMTAQ